MVPYSNAGRSLIEFLVTLLIGLAPVACGLLVLALQVDRKQEETIAVTANEAIYAIDRVIETLHESSTQALKFTGNPCDDILPELRKEVIKQPNVRSMALEKDHRFFCSTLYGSTDYMIDEGSDVNERLRVAAGNRATPNSAILRYRKQTSPYAVVAVADLRVLQAELLGFQNAVVLSLQFGTQYIWATGHGDASRVPNQAQNSLKLTSEQFGYTVHAGYPEGQTWRAMRQAMNSTFPSLLLVGIMTSAAGYWGLYRRAKGRQTQKHAR